MEYGYTHVLDVTVPKKQKKSTAAFAEQVTFLLFSFFTFPLLFKSKFSQWRHYVNRKKMIALKISTFLSAFLKKNFIQLPSLTF